MEKNSNEYSVVCPSCDSKIEINDILRGQIRDQVESDIEDKIKAERRQMADVRKRIEAEKSELANSQASLDDLVAHEVKKRESEIKSSAVEKAKQDFELKLTNRQTQIDEMSQKLHDFRKSELLLLQQKRELETEKAEMKLQVARELDAERGILMEKAKDQFKQEFDLKQAEKDKQIGDMLKKIDDLKRKAEQGSQQLQGEVKELALEDLLDSNFPSDGIEPVQKGVRGADSLQRVLNTNGHVCGSILWESKRTKAWQKGWLEKLRDDQRNSKSECAVLVSEVLPTGITTFGLVDSVWVCSWSCVVGLATALRLGLIEMSKANVAAEGQIEKMELVYQYLAGQEFQQRVGAIVEAFVSMQSDLEKEKRSMNSIWNKRAKQLERAINGASGLYGDLNGIVGSTLPILPELSLKMIGDQTDEGPNKNRMSA